MGQIIKAESFCDLPDRNAGTHHHLGLFNLSPVDIFVHRHPHLFFKFTAQSAFRQIKLFCQIGDTNILIDLQIDILQNTADQRRFAAIRHSVQFFCKMYDRTVPNCQNSHKISLILYFPRIIIPKPDHR